MDQAAWSELMSIYGPTVYRWCRLAGLSPEDAADVVQDVFQTTFLRLDQFVCQDASSSFQRWLYSIFRSRLVDFFRLRNKQPGAIGGTAFKNQITNEIAWPEHSNLESTDHTILMRVLDHLRLEVRPSHWQAFWQTAVLGHRPRDVAAALGISSAAVCMCRARILRRVREKLNGLESFPN